jgi:NAD(P)-dependent dehydrogenase (short-subunit alcohol dehydrogenase family)
VQVTDELMDSVLNTNVKSVAFAFKHQLPAIEKSGGKGSVVVNTSIMGVTATTQEAFHGAGVYSASKAAANMLTQYAVSSTCQQIAAS